MQVVPAVSWLEAMLQTWEREAAVGLLAGVVGQRSTLQDPACSHAGTAQEHAEMGAEHLVSQEQGRFVQPAAWSAVAFALT